EIHLDAVNRQGVTQRHQVRGALGALDTGDARDRQGIALGYAATAQRGDHRGRDEYASGRRGRPGGEVLGRHVDHPGRALVVDVGQLRPVGRRPGHYSRRRSSRTVSTTWPAATSVTCSGTTIKALA